MVSVSDLVNLAKTSPMKLVGVGVILAMFVGFIYWYDSSRVQAGRDQQKVICLEERNQAIALMEENNKEKLADLQKELDELLVSKREWRGKAVSFQEALTKSRKEALDLKEEIDNVQSNQCTSLGTDHGRLLNIIIGDPPAI